MKFRSFHFGQYNTSIGTYVEIIINTPEKHSLVPIIQLSDVTNYSLGGGI